MNKPQNRKLITLDDEEFFEFLDMVQRLIGEEELPDRIVLEWKDGSKIIYEFKNNNWYETIIEE